MKEHGVFVCAASAAIALAAGGASAGHWASAVIDYDPGTDPAFGYTDPAAALGAASRMSGASFGFPSVVSPFSPPFETDQIVSIGHGGSITLRMGRKIRDAAHHAFGVDFIVFANAGFIDVGYPSGLVGNAPTLFGVGASVLIEASNDNLHWFTVEMRRLDLFPTLGYLDSGPFDALPGSIESDFRVAMDPSLSLSDVAGLSYAELIALYGTSGGGIGLDLASSGLSEARYLRFTHGGDSFEPFEIDAVSVVPAPGGLAALMVGAGLALRRSRSSAKERGCF
ncbi:MAG: hypothetical protein KF757_08095 [Phycisphaeraceae bacterium]|nr:hypothetical protein [Phycisphaeraceae bacterium]MCW5762716.1 hypothetical protein [Phycisphaeraceae bacterium]